MTRFALMTLVQGKVPLWLTKINNAGWSFEDNYAVTFDSHVDAWHIERELQRRGHKDPLFIVTAPSFKRSPSLHPPHWSKRKKEAGQAAIREVAKFMTKAEQDLAVERKT